MHLHPVDENTLHRDLDTPAHISGRGAGCRLAGTGTPLVAERAVEELGAALGVSYRSGSRPGHRRVGAAYRLPRLWALVQAGMLQAWKARKVAQETTHLGAEAVAFVDAQAAIAGAKNRITPNLPGLVHEALIRFEPEKARAREEAAQNRREVRFDYRRDDGLPGRPPCTRRLDCVDGSTSTRPSPTSPNQLGRLGDDSPLDERRARALGALAHPQEVLDLVRRQPTEPGPADHGRATQRNRSADLATWATSTSGTTASATIYLHIDPADLRATLDGDLTPGTVEKRGAASST